MSNSVKTVKVPTAIETYSELDLSCQHITTSNFMDINVAKCMELVPHQSVDVYHNIFSRLEPLAVPTFGDASFHNKAFFVPYRTIFPAWNDFINDVPHQYSDGVFAHVPYVPRLPNSMLVEFLTNSLCADEVTSSDINEDIVVINGSGVGDYKRYNLTPFGRRVFKILQQLGYGLDFNLTNEETYHSYMPLLAYAKVYMDWYYPSQYAQDSIASAVNYLFTYDSSQELYEYSYQLGLVSIFEVITKVNYDADYFTSAWDNPVGPTDGTFSSVTIPDVTNLASANTNTKVNVDDNGTPYLSSSSNVTSRLTDFGLNALKRLNDYMTRHRIAGARVLDRYLSRFGVKLSDEALKRSNYLDSFNSYVNFGDVTSTADTEGQTLGSYAGKGIVVDRGHYEYTNGKEYGMFIIISSVVPRTAYYQGADRTTMHLTKFDFWTPEFDNMGVQAISTRELYMPLDSRKQYPVGSTTRNPINWDKCVFGFTSRYAEYKRQFDQITGDYRLNSRNTGKDAWNLFRNLDDVFAENGVLNTKHDADFVVGNDSNQFNRIFQVTDSNYDHFNIIHDFRIKSRFPGKSLYDSYEFENEDTDKVTIENGGVKAN